MAEAAWDTTKLNTGAETARRTALAQTGAEAQRVEAAGAADAARVKADADAYAEAINARADALSGEHQALIAANKLVDMLPALVQASASGIEGARLTILGGSQGVNDFTTGLAAQGLSIYTALQSLLASGANGAASEEERLGDLEDVRQAPGLPVERDDAPLQGEPRRGGCG